MSLYEQFFSEINKEYMYDMLQKVIKKDYDYDIKQNNGENYTYFNTKMKTIFEENNFDDIRDINEVLLNETVSELGRKFNDTENDNGNDNGNDNDNDNLNKPEDMLSRMIRERENIFTKEKESKNIIKKENKKENVFLNEDNPTSISEGEKEDHGKVDDEGTTISFNSSQRVNNKSSRYNYMIDLVKERVNSHQLKSISKLIIPIEDNYIFSIPVILLKIKELNLTLYLQQTELIKNKYNTVGVFEPIEKHIIEPKNINRISIDIRDISGVKYSNNDILKINIIEIKENILILTCSEINQLNYHSKDMIKVIINNNRSIDIDLIELLLTPIRINIVNGNMIYCKLNGDYKDKVYNNIDMKIMNISNQNLLFFNQGS
tara:strand:+ start:5179 stop:6306 length:1128 start_codon:yes stop_codon:yes gene_type:complete